MSITSLGRVVPASIQFSALTKQAILALNPGDAVLINGQPGQVKSFCPSLLPDNTPFVHQGQIGAKFPLSAFPPDKPKPEGGLKRTGFLARLFPNVDATCFRAKRDAFPGAALPVHRQEVVYQTPAGHCYLAVTKGLGDGKADTVVVTSQPMASFDKIPDEHVVFDQVALSQ